MTVYTLHGFVWTERKQDDTLECVDLALVHSANLRCRSRAEKMSSFLWYGSPIDPPVATSPAHEGFTPSDSAQYQPSA